jgi:hypothetical protein
MKFHMQLGYSLAGFEEVSGQREASYYVTDAVGEEAAFDYVLRKHKGTVLKL